MNILRNRFLGTASFLSAPDDPSAGGKKPLALSVEDVTGAAQTDGDDDVSDDTGAGVGGDAGDAGDDEDGDGEGGDASGDEDDDPDLADLPAEVRAKAKAAIERRVARETGWRDRQIDRLHAKRRSAEEDVRAAEAVVGRRADGTTAAPGNPTDAQIEERAQVLAKNMSAQAQYDQNANDADARGSSVYGDKWRTTMGKLPKLGGVDVADMVDILNTDQPHVVLFSLADPETYERVMALPPARRRNEFVKLSLKEAPKARSVQTESKRPGNSARPVVPLGGGRKTAAQRVDLADDNLSDDDWYTARNATRRKKFSDHA